jgi:hypothetical protein
LAEHVITEGDFSRGYYVQPAIIAGLPDDHELVKTRTVPADPLRERR